MIAVATTTRADWGLLRPLAEALRQHCPVDVLAGNMHLLPQCGMTVEEIETDGFSPVRIPSDGTPAEIASQALAGYARALGAKPYRALVALGDRFEMLPIAEAALLLGIPVVHIAGGTVSEGAIDNKIRDAISMLSSLHFPETENGARRLAQMGIPAGSITVAGALGLSGIMEQAPMCRQELEQSLGFRLDGPVLLVTLHAATLDPVSPLARMHQLLEALEQSPEKIVITYPNNDVDPAPQIRLIEQLAAQRPGQVLAVPSLGHRRYLSMLRIADAVVGNSSSGIVEVPSFGIPTLDIGIRQQGRERAESVWHCEADTGSIAQGLEHVLSPAFRQKCRECQNPYYNPRSVEIIAGRILTFIS